MHNTALDAVGLGTGVGSSHTSHIAGLGSSIIKGSGNKCCSQVTCLCDGCPVDTSILYLVSQPPSKCSTIVIFVHALLLQQSFICIFPFPKLNTMLFSTIQLTLFSRLHSNNYNISNQVAHSLKFSKIYMLEFQVLQFNSTK